MTLLKRRFNLLVGLIQIYAIYWKKSDPNQVFPVAPISSNSVKQLKDIEWLRVSVNNNLFELVDRHKIEAKKREELETLVLFELRESLKIIQKAKKWKHSQNKNVRFMGAAVFAPKKAFISSLRSN